MLKKLLLSCLGVVLLSNIGRSQDAPYQTYPLLDVTINPSTRALGGVLYSDVETNFGVTQFAPSELDSTYHKKIETDYAILFDGVKHISLSGAWAWKPTDIFSINFQTINYGSFERRDEENIYLGDYSAASYDLSLNYSKKLSSKWRAGVSMHTLFSKMDIYDAFALSFNASASYKVKSFSAAFVVRNIGVSINQLDESKVSLPLDVGFTLVKSLDHAPFIFYLTAHHLNEWDAVVIGDDSDSKEDYSHLLNHINFGTRLRFSSHFCLMAGYNNMIRESIGSSSSKGTSGMSFGFQIDTSKFQLAYSFSPMHKSNIQHSFGFQLKL
ncbi:PorV/PorQ family protein [Halosquirtibacter xylanolyticus]|uniref:PorV/PorQ family protein n=1 Tax=Halosquirtibacter xylanolyticus TaxID=3374599 RepID=UPI0037491731|nr:PorV/PorQ family protein [Prolixibacteraceae bacterium]